MCSSDLNPASVRHIFTKFQEATEIAIIGGGLNLLVSFPDEMSKLM